MDPEGNARILGPGEQTAAGDVVVDAPPGREPQVHGDPNPAQARAVAALRTGLAQPKEAVTPEAPGALPNDVDIVDALDVQDGRSLVEKVRDFGQAFYRQWVNRNAPLERLAKAAGAGGKRLKELVVGYRGVAAAARGPIDRGTRLFDDSIGGYRETGRGLRQILGESDQETVRDLSRWMAAERQKELAERQQKKESEYLQAQEARAEIQRQIQNARRRQDFAAVEQLRAQLPPKPTRDGFIDIDPDAVQRADDTLAVLQAKWGDRVSTLVGLSGEVRNWSRHAILEPLREVGYLSEKSYQRILDENQQYAPFLEVMEGLDSQLEVVASLSRPLKKITRDISVGRLNPLEGFVLKAQQVHVWVERQRIRNQIAKLADENPVIAREVQALGRMDPRTSLPRDSFGVYKDGVLHAYRTNPEISHALDLLSPQQANLLVRGLGAVSRFKRLGATLSPGFALRNFLRDQQTAAVNSEYGYVPYVDFMVGFLAQTPLATKRMRQMYEEFLASGASLAGMVGADQKGAAQTLEGITRQTGALNNARVKLREMVQRDGVLAPLGALSRILETATRLGAFSKARGKGATQLEAATEAREVTLDFGRMGETGQTVNSLIAFANAEIQDVDRFVRRFRSKPVEALTKAFTYITLPSLAHAFMHRDDEEYQNLHEVDRALFYHLKKEDGGYWRWPRPMGVLNLLFGYGVEKVVQAVGQEDPDAIRELMGAAVEQTPLHYVAADTSEGYTPFNPSNYFDMLFTAFTPLAEARGNIDTFRDRPIIPVGEDPDPRYQGEGRLGPVTRSLARIAGISPYNFEHLVGGYSATLGRTALETANRLATSGESGTQAKEPFDLAQFLGFRSRRPIGFGSKPVGDFYQLLTRVENAHRTAGNRADQGDGTGWLEVTSQTPELTLLKQLRHARSSLRDLRKMRAGLLEAPGLTPEQLAPELLNIDHTATLIALRAMEDAKMARKAAGK